MTSFSPLAIKATATTRGDMVIPVDYNDGTAADPPASSFRAQADVDRFLQQNSANAVKHIEAAWKALPAIVVHDVQFNLAAGVHRPLPAQVGQSVGFDLTGISFIAQGSFQILGDTGYTQIVASQTIGSHTATEDPEVTAASGTPWTGLDLRGKLAVLSTGQVSAIHANTGNQLFLCSEISPVLTGGETVEVVRPSTIIRNSIDDAVRVGTSTCFSLAASRGMAFALINDIQFDGFGETGLNASTIRFTANRLLFDHEFQRVNFSVNPNGRDVQIGDNETCVLRNCGYYADPANMASRDEPVTVFASAGTISRVILGESYIGNVPGFRYIGAFFKGGLDIENVVLDNVGSSGPSVWALDSTLGFNHFTSFGRGCRNRIINKTGAGPGVLMQQFSSIFRQDVQGVKFDNVAGNSVEVESDCSFDMSASTVGCQNISGDSAGGVGIKVSGTNVSMSLPSGNDVSGTGGEMEVEGIVTTYADIEAEPFSTLVTSAFNRIKKAP